MRINLYAMRNVSCVRSVLIFCTQRARYVPNLIEFHTPCPNTNDGFFTMDVTWMDTYLYYRLVDEASASRIDM